ncbi:MAG: TetR/AcrR family transcriptional regulator [Hyphomonadaceae bacterium]
MSEAAVVEPIGKRERAKAANRQAILAAARRVFAEMGYEAATVRDVIRGTDLASGTFYNYFRSKEEVFDALTEDAVQRFQPLLRAARERASSFEEYLALAFTAYFQFVIQENRIEGKPAGERAPHVRTDTPEMKAIYQEVREGIEAAIARGAAPPIDADFLTFACIGIAQEVGAAMMRRSPPNVEAATQFAVGLILRGLGPAQR